MSVSGNAKLVLELMKDNYKEVTEINKRLCDRMTIVLGLTVTGFGLIIKMDDKSHTMWSSLFLGVSLAGLALCFLTAIRGLFPKRGEQPGKCDVDFLWAEYVAVDEEAAFANVLNDICVVLKSRREVGVKMAWWFRTEISMSALTVLSVSVSELITVFCNG
jgi:hypothetical protein